MYSTYNFTSMFILNFFFSIRMYIYFHCTCIFFSGILAFMFCSVNSKRAHRPPPPPPRLITKLQSYSASCIQHLVFVILQNTVAINKTRPMAYCHCPIVQSIGQLLHDDVILLQLPESLSLLSLILSRIDKFK